MHGQQELSGGQAKAEPLSVLPVSKVFDRGDGTRGGEDGFTEGTTGAVAV